MKIDWKSVDKHHQNYWLFAGVVAFTLGTTGLVPTGSAYADTITEIGNATESTMTSHNHQDEESLEVSKSEANAEMDTDRSDKSESEVDLQQHEDKVDSQDGEGHKTTKPEKGIVAPPTDPVPKPDKTESVVPNTPSQPNSNSVINQVTPVASVKKSLPTVNNIIPDKNLQRVVLYAIQQTHPEVTDASQITTDLLGELTEIDLWNDKGKKQRIDRSFYNAVINIKSLNGLQYAKNLTTLAILPDRSVSKEIGKAGQHGQLSDISALKGLTKLASLNLSWNQIADESMSVISSLKGLTSLNLSNNRITDLSAISNLVNLKTINFSQSADSKYKITSLKPLTALINLTHVSFSNNDISDLTPLKHITSPEMMSFGGNHIFDITPLLALDWKPFFPGAEVRYSISADGQTWTTAQATLNSATTKLSTWSFAYDNLHFNEFMEGDPNSTGEEHMIGGGNWSTWSELKMLDATHGQLKLHWGVDRHNDLTKPVAPNGLMFSGIITVPYTLAPSVGAVTVAFQLNGVVNIAPFVILSGKTGDTFDVLNDASVQKTIANLENRGFAYENSRKHNHNLTNVVESSKVIYDSDAQSIVLIFNPLQKIYLVDEMGNAIGDKLIKKSGQMDSSWKLNLPEINGYDFDRVEGNGTVTDRILSGTIRDVNQDIYLYYKANGKPIMPPVTPVVPGKPAAVGTVVVHYQTATGEELAPNDRLVGKVGQYYATIPKPFKGYKLAMMPINARGVYTSVNQDVNYTYQIVESGGKPAMEVPGTPTRPESPSHLAEGGNGDNQVNLTQPIKKQAIHKLQGGRALKLVTKSPKQVEAMSTKTSVLPQTNDQQTSSWWGEVLLTVTSIFFGFKWMDRFRNE